MKVLLIISSLLVAHALAQSSDQISDAKQCLKFFGGVIGSITTMDVEAMIEWAKDVKETTERLEHQKETCDEIPRKDPPTKIESFIINACSSAHDASVAFETARLFVKLEEANPGFAESLRDYAPSCLNLIL